MRLGSIYKLQLAASSTECKRLGDLRAVTSGGEQEQGQHGPGQHLLKPAAAVSSGADHGLGVNKANTAIFSSEAQLLKQWNCRCLKRSGTAQISGNRW